MRVTGALRLVAGLLGRLRRPEGIAENTRWLFAALALLALLIGLAPPLSSSRGAVLVMVLAAALMLTLSCVFVYVRKAAPPALDVLDAVAITAIATASPDPTAVFGYVFTAVFFRTLYGPTWQSLARCGMGAAAIGAAVWLWPLIPGHTGTPEGGALVGTLPLLLVVVLVGRQLHRVLVDREQGLCRDAAVAEAGSRLLGVTDATTIRTVAWDTATEICAATPGLCLLKAVRDGEVLRVERAVGAIGERPATIPGDVIATDPDAARATVSNPAPLNAIARVRPGTNMNWVCIRLTELEQATAWMVIGAPKEIPSAALLAVRSLVNQVSLALRTSGVHQELTVQARVDSLTGLANRASFGTELSALLDHRDEADSLHVLFLDLDDFKDVNDILGHRAGDELLVQVAARLRRFTRPDDICARLGGDEFAVVLRGATDDGAEQTAQRIVTSIGEPIHLSGRTARVGASIGITTATPGIDIEELVHQADVAMYAAKAYGKGRTQVFNPGLLHADTSRLVFERELAAAADAGQLVVHYQPILGLPELRCDAIEALVRWEHPERGLLLPGDFIETAERTGAILAIGAFVLRRACEDGALMQAAHPGSPFAVHVNVSARQLDHDQFIDAVASCLADSGLPAAQLVLELTETVVLNSPAAIERLTLLAAHGVQIAIDDFGTGYSSLTTLRSLPVNVVKLDRTFIAGALGNPVDQTVMRAVVRMSRQLGMRTIAEGVERLEQQKFLDEIGTDALQGYLYLRPVPAPQLATWLETNLSTNVVTLRPVRQHG